MRGIRLVSYVTYFSSISLASLLHLNEGHLTSSKKRDRFFTLLIDFVSVKKEFLQKM